MTPCPRPVGHTVRVFCAAAAGLGLWQVGWIADQSSRLGEFLPAPWSPTFWIAAWSFVAVAGAVAAVTGADVATRVALVALATTSGLGIVTALALDLSMGHQFWQVGQAALIVVVCFALLVSPLRDDTVH